MVATNSLPLVFRSHHIRV